MDIISHGLWGGIVFGRKNKRDFWWAFALGVMPDLFSFGIFTVATTLGFSTRINWGGHPMDSLVPEYVHLLYNISHSLVTFVVVFGVIYLIRKKPFLPMLAWLLHILMDIPTHTTEFFATPFLWPLSTVKVNGFSWGHPIILIPDLVILIILYIWFFIIKNGWKK